MKIAPGAALRFFYTKLTKRQTRSCIRRALATAVIHAFDALPPDPVQKGDFAITQASCSAIKASTFPWTC